MRKKIICLLMAAAMLCTACQNTEEEPKEKIDLRPEIAEVLENPSYENIEIMFDEMENYDGQELIIANVSDYIMGEGMTYEETMELYSEDVFPALLDVEKIDKQFLFDINTLIKDDDPYRIREYEKNYDDIMATIDEYEEVPELKYQNTDNYAVLYYTGNWVTGLYVSQGVLGSYADSLSPFGACKILEEVKRYDCRLDDLSDTYMLMDGEKSVAEAKEEIEAYLNAHHPINEMENGIDNEVYNIKVCKIKDTDYYAFHAFRTLSYNGIPIREFPITDVGPDEELTWMAECVLCESNKLDITLGLIDTFEEPVKERVIQEYIPFAEVMERVSYYLTGETKFQLLHGGIEYRMFGADEGLSMVPYWSFIARNPKDDTLIKVYVDIETGEVTHHGY